MPTTTKKRSFTIVTAEGCKGRYLSTTPSSVAKKIGNKVLKQKKVQKITIEIRETTKDSKKKVYKYQVSRVKNPKTIVRAGKTITYNYEVKVKSKK